MLIPLRARRADPLRRRRRAGRGRWAPTASSRIVDVADVGEDAHPRARRDQDPGLGLHAVAPGRGPARADADRRVPRRRPARVRRPRSSRQLAAAQEQQRPRRPAGAAALRRHLDGRLTAPVADPAATSAGSVEVAEHDAGARAWGGRTWSSGGMRSPPWAMATIWATVAGRSSTPAWASPWPTPVDARGRRRAGTRARGGGSVGEGGVEAAGVEVAGAGERVGPGREEPGAVGRRPARARPARPCVGARCRRRRVDRRRASKNGSSAAAEVEAVGEAREQAVDRQHGRARRRPARRRRPSRGRRRRRRPSPALARSSR